LDWKKKNNKHTLNYMHIKKNTQKRKGKNKENIKLKLE